MNVSGVLATCIGELPSWTVAVKVDVPLAVGVPLSTPPGLRVKPSRLPPVADHVYVPKPPAAAKLTGP